MAQNGETKLQRERARVRELTRDQSSWISQWQEISQYLLPRNGRFLGSQENHGGKKHNNIYDSTATIALRVLTAGLMAGMTSPARPWFRLATPDPDLMEFAPVKLWLDKVTKLMREVFARSNTYRALHAVYEELGGFGTGASIFLPNYDNVMHAHTLTVGEYALATNELGEVDTLTREYSMTVRQLVAKFGRSEVSNAVRSLYDTNKLDVWVPVTHIIQPRTDRDLSSKKAKNMPWASCYFESGGNEDKYLREGGFKNFPVTAPRWAVSGGDIYGHSPGMEALGDVKQLQHQQFRKAQGIDYQTKPPMQAPASYKEAASNFLPGGVSTVDMAGGGGLKPAFESNLNLQHLLLDIQDVRERIREAFYYNLFLMLANDDRSNITAREVAERHEEKLLMLGPVLERLHSELLSKLIDIAFDYMVEAGILPEPPEELQGLDLNVEFVSVLAQAQRAIGVQSTDQLVMKVGQIAIAKQSMDPWDKLDVDQIIDGYADMLGVDPSYIVADDKVAIVREDRAKQQAAMQQAAVIQQGAATAKDLAQADTSGQNALTDVMQSLTGYSSGA